MLTKIQYISQGATIEEQIQNCEHVLQAGCKWIQVRFKKANPADFRTVAKKVKELCQKKGATFIINDHIDVAKELDADGVHLGLTDSPIELARTILGPNKIIGGTANTLEDVLKRIEEKCDYIGLGPFKFTSTKDKLSPILGVEGYTTILRQLPQKHIPIFAIGGIELNDIEEITSTGIDGIAVSGLLTLPNNPLKMVTKLNQKLHGNTQNS